MFYNKRIFEVILKADMQSKQTVKNNNKSVRSINSEEFLDRLWNRDKLIEL